MSDFTCPFCPAVRTTAHGMAAHLAGAHPSAPGTYYGGMKPYFRCPCGARAGTSFDVLVHLRDAAGLTPEDWMRHFIIASMSKEE